MPIPSEVRCSRGGRGRESRGPHAALAVLLAVAGVLVAAPSAASVLVRHAGNTPPTEQGWEGAGGGLVYDGPVVTPGGTAAWNLSDDSSNRVRFYRYGIPVARQREIDQSGWVYRARIRVVAGEAVPDGGVWLETSSIRQRFMLALGRQADGDPVIRLMSAVGPGVFEGTPIALEGLGDGFHLYELTYDPVTATARVQVDGVTYADGYAGARGNLGAAFWGVGIQTANANADFGLVELVALPEPATAGLLAVGMLALAGRRRGS